MNWLMKIFGWPMGLIMFACYFIVPNYGLALILFTIVTRLMLFPISLKQQKEQAKMAVYRPKMDAIQKKYANNKEKYNEELQKLYSEEHYNPLSGCLPSLIQFPLLFGLIDVIYKPLTHILRIGEASINSGLEIAKSLGVELSVYSPQINMMNAVHSNPDAFSSLGAETVEKILSLNMNFIGLDLTQVPQFKLMLDGAFNFLLLIPILSGVSSLLFSMITMKTTAATSGEGAAQANAMSKGMMLMMPLFSVYIAFIVPAGVGFYWLLSNVLMLLQSLYLNKKYNPQELADKMIAEQEADKETKRQEKIEAKKMIAEGSNASEEVKIKSLSQKELNRRKLAEARRRDAEKYGEEYVDVTDEDLK